METTPGTTFRNFLRNELKERSQKNASYSLRAFAKQLGVSAAGLSKVMSGKMPLSLSFIEKIGDKLKLSEEQVQSHQITLLSEKKGLNTREKEFEFIEQERFEIIKEWYHYGILNLMRVEGFKPNASWVAKRLGITIGEVQGAVERLQNVGLLKVEDSKWVDVSSIFISHTNNKKFSEAAKENQKQLFTKALSAIDEVDFKERNHTGTGVAFSLKDLDQVKEFINKFRKEFASRFDRQHGADDVYQLSVAFFPLTKKRK